MMGRKGLALPHERETEMKITIELPNTYAVTSRGVGVEVNVENLKPEIIALLALHGLGQKIGDSAASALADAGFAGMKYGELSDNDKAKVQEAAKAAMDQTRVSLEAGQWAERRAASGMSELEQESATVFGAFLRENHKDVWAKTFKDMEAKDRPAALAKLLADQPEEFRASVEAMAKDAIAERAAKKAKIASLSVKLAI